MSGINVSYLVPISYETETLLRYLEGKYNCTFKELVGEAVREWYDEEWNELMAQNMKGEQDETD